MLASLIFATVLAPKPLILAHYMPWHQAPPYSKGWGWHWTMNHFDPEKVVDGRRQIASRLYPLIGPYDNTDPAVLEYHTLLMKIAGIDGAILDWYGIDDVYDYSYIHKASQQFVDLLTRSGMKFGVCYEDQTLPNLIKFGVTTEQDSVTYGRKVFNWLEENWLKKPNYMRVNGRPAVMVFGPQFYKGDQWPEITRGIDVEMYGVMGPHRFANGGFAWPAPKETYSKSQQEMDSFYARAKGSSFIAGAYPRFKDIYKSAGLDYGHPIIDDRDGETFRSTLGQALDSGSPIVQIATWNDWGEGTVIEPSKEFGYRDLELIQQIRKDRFGEKRKFTKSDLRLPLRLLLLRRSGKVKGAELDAVGGMILKDNPSGAAKKLGLLEAKGKR